MNDYITNQNKLRSLKNQPKENTFGFVQRYQYPILTNQHIPAHWVYDLNPVTNPYFLPRLGVNALFNAGAIHHNGKYILVNRIEGYDRKSFFALAESTSGIDGFEFRQYPIVLPQTNQPDTNVYDMRLTAHQDGWIYGLFCTERRPLDAPTSDQSIALAACGIVRTKDLEAWERLPDLKTSGSQQRNVVLHPEFVDGKYGLYTRPQDGFIDTRSGGGIGWALCDDLTNARIEKEVIIDPKIYHTINEVKNGQGPPPIKTNEGWLHLAHGVRNTAAGLRYVLYAFMTNLDRPWEVIYKPGGYFMAPKDEERVGDVPNVLFCNGWIARETGEVNIYYASSDTRLHVATSMVSHLIDYCKHTPQDPLYSHLSAAQRIDLIRKNETYLKEVKH